MEDDYEILTIFPLFLKKLKSLIIEHQRRTGGGQHPRRGQDVRFQIQELVKEAACYLPIETIHLCARMDDFFTEEIRDTYIK